MSKKPKSSSTTKVGRNAASGQFMGVRIADPVVRPRTTTVAKIRNAVRDAAAGSEKRQSK